MTTGRRTDGRRFGVSLGLLAVLLLALLAPIHATGQLRAALGAEALPLDLFSSVQLCQDHGGDGNSSPNLGFCDLCVPCGRLLLAPPSLDRALAAWNPRPVQPLFYAAEASWQPLVEWRRTLPVVRGPPSA